MEDNVPPTESARDLIKGVCGNSNDLMLFGEKVSQTLAETMSWCLRNMRSRSLLCCAV